MCKCIPKLSVSVNFPGVRFTLLEQSYMLSLQHLKVLPWEEKEVHGFFLLTLG